jgi:class 3 adenylate cyclase
MSLRDELISEVRDIFRNSWNSRDGNVVPESENLGLGNEAVKLDAVVLYADMAESTALVDSYSATFAAEIYKAYLHCAAKIIRFEGGAITAYDGDRIMAVFIGNMKNTSAVKAALKLNHARFNIINSAIKAQYTNVSYEVKHVVGIDNSNLLAARTGIRGANDLVWVGRAANHAAKLTTLNGYSTWITKEVYESLDNSAKLDDKGYDMWKVHTWTQQMGRIVYGSNHHWIV